MTRNGKEGIPIARIFAADAAHVVGLLYQWSDGGLGVRWDDDMKLAKYVDPPIESEVLEEAAMIDDAAFLIFLASLRPVAGLERR